MDDVDALVAEAREVARQVSRLARARLASGADVTKIQQIVGVALERLEDVELCALLASGGDRDALERGHAYLAELVAVRDSLRP